MFLGTRLKHCIHTALEVGLTIRVYDAATVAARVACPTVFLQVLGIA